MTKPTQPSVSPSEAVASLPGICCEAVVCASEAWLKACTGMMSASVAAMEAQAQFAAAWTKFWLEDAGLTPLARSGGTAEGELAVIDAESEQLAEAIHASLYRMGGGATGMALPE